MKFAISYSPPYHGVDPDTIVGYAQHAEACGFEGFYLPEHIVLYRGATIGSVEMPPSLSYLDPLDCLSFVAAATSRILLGTGVLQLPYHHPVTLAKRLATVDVLSGGRMHIGGSSRAAARRAGRRGDGFFPGGMVHPDERATQLKMVRHAAAEAGRDPDALEYTRMGSIDMTIERAEQLAAEGVTRVVVGSAATDPSEQRDEMSALAERFGLRS